jgi:hypothetical protein
LGSLAVALVAVGTALATWPRSPDAAVAAPGACRIATVGGTDITEADAEELSAQLSPPPSRAEASRLAVDAALASWVVRGYVAPASPARRLASYRELLARLGTRAPDATVVARTTLGYLARAAQRIGVEPGPCLSPRAGPEIAAPPVSDTELAALRQAPRSIERRLAERARGRSILHATVWRAWPVVERIDLGPVLGDELEPELAAAIEPLSAGQWSRPVVTRTGIYVAEALTQP